MKSSQAGNKEMDNQSNKDNLRGGLVELLVEALYPEVLKELVRVESTLAALSQLGQGKALEQIYGDARQRTRQQRERLAESLSRRISDVVGRLQHAELGAGNIGGGGATTATAPPNERQALIKRMMASGRVAMEEIVIGSPSHHDAQLIEETAVTTPEDPYLALVKGLPKGGWLEFTRPDGHVYRAQLAWNNGERCLFINERGIKVGDKSVEIMAAEFRAGRARCLEAGADGSLLNRSVGSLITGVRKGSSR
ncbi:MAG: DUF1631 family protein [Gammaproteobacteria bacterium]|nr:DUF1631 family protein [Gammaproteobacteria bacterium]